MLFLVRISHNGAASGCNGKWETIFVYFAFGKRKNEHKPRIVIISITEAVAAATSTQDLQVKERTEGLFGLKIDMNLF